MSRYRGRGRVWARCGCAGCSVPLLAALAAIVAAVVLAAGCGGGTPANPPPAGTQGANALVCRHYLAQRAWMKHITYPTLADVLKLEGYAAADEAQAQPGTQLRRDLGAMVTAMANSKPDFAASVLVYHDCAG